jgi:hypothetical protein
LPLPTRGREIDKLSQQSLDNSIQMLATTMANHETAMMYRETAKKNFDLRWRKNFESARDDIKTIMMR